jgi:hypothetical protein
MQITDCQKRANCDREAKKNHGRIGTHYKLSQGLIFD